MRKKEQTKQAISLITLVITIIIMIILAGAIVVTLSNSGIFNKANDAVNKYNLKEVQAIADLAWSEAYADGIRDKDGLQDAVDKALKDNGLEGKYEAIADEKGVAVTEKEAGDGGNQSSQWVREYVEEDVPIPVGFVASPYGESENYPAENTKAGGLVIYALTPEEIEDGVTDILAIDGQNGKLTEEEAHYVSLTTRNQFVWVPVDKDNFINEFKRTEYYIKGWGETQPPSCALGFGFWELVLTDDNMPSQDTDSDNTTKYVSPATLSEATEMYASVAEYGGFYIARYEVGYSNYDEEYNRIPSITMGKYPYNYVNWSDTMTETAEDGGAVALSRAFYPNNSENTTGVVSTLTYGVQWDTTLNWWTNINLEDSTEYGNYYNTSRESGEYNEGAQYATYDHYYRYWSNWSQVKDKEDVDTWLLTTGAFKNANVNNIYDMAGNLCEWTMEGWGSADRVPRGGDFSSPGNIPAISRDYDIRPYTETYNIGFRPSLYIKK